MGDESVHLTNHRLAPLQIASFGHPVSTFGGEVDYFLSGADLEAPEHPERNYSERLVLLPGMGCVHNAPPFPRPALAAARRLSPGDRLLINCPAFGQKLNVPFLRTLARVVREAARPVRIRFFVGGAATVGNDYLPLREHLAALLGAEAVEVPLELPYDQYLSKLSEGALALDAFPFGGGNTVTDSLFLGIPMLCREGIAVTTGWVHRCCGLRGSRNSWLQVRRSMCGSHYG